MSFYADTIPDERVRAYLPVSRILAASQAEHTERLIGNREIQNWICGPDAIVLLKPNGSILLDFGREIAGGIRFVLAGQPGKIRLTFGESVSEAIGTPNPDHAVHQTVLDTAWLSTFEYGNTGFRFVQIQNAGETNLEFINILAVLIYRNLPRIGSFVCSDPLLNRIWEVCADTIQLNLQDFVYDGIKRDRLVWQGDMFPEAKAAFVLFDDVSCIGKSLDFMRDHTPPDQDMNRMTTYSLWYIITLREYYVRTADKSFLETHRERIFQILDRFSGYVADNGSECIDGCRFLDWKTNDNSVASAAGLHGLLYWAMGCGVDFARLFGKDPALFEQKQAQMRKFQPQFAGNKSAAALLSASGFGDYSAVFENNKEEGWSAFLSCFMYSGMKTVPALNALKRYYGGMIQCGATSFWEDFDLSWLENAGRIDELPVPGKKDPHADFGAYCYKGLRHSLCHGWAAGPMAFLTERILGVRYASPGGTELTILPDLGDLEYAAGTIPTPQGLVEISCQKGAQPVIKLPDGCRKV